MRFETVALFGATGQIGQRILQALVNCRKQPFHVIRFVPPADRDKVQAISGVETQFVDLMSIGKEDLATMLKGVHVVVSALNGKALEAQPLVQDAADAAHVQRFYPSEYGMHHIYRKPGDSYGYIHPMWNVKDMYNEMALRHPAINAGRMTYTLIGCGDFYDQEREKIWCPWTQTDVNKYTFHIVKDADAKADFTNLHDFAAFLVATLCEPEKSENASLNFVSDHVSYNDIAALLEKYAKRPVEKKVLPEEEMHDLVANPKAVPAELREGSAFPVDFWLLVKGIQGQGRFWRPCGQIHNHLFPDVQVTTFESYFQQRFR